MPEIVGISHIDLTVTDRHVEQQDTNVDDIVDLRITAKVGGSLKGEELPIGDWVRDAMGDEQLTELDSTGDPEEGTFPITAVRQSLRGRVSELAGWRPSEPICCWGSAFANARALPGAISPTASISMAGRCRNCSS